MTDIHQPTRRSVEDIDEALRRSLRIRRETRDQISRRLDQVDTLRRTYACQGVAVDKLLEEREEAVARQAVEIITSAEGALPSHEDGTPLPTPQPTPPPEALGLPCYCIPVRPGITGRNCPRHGHTITHQE